MIAYPQPYGQVPDPGAWRDRAVYVVGRGPSLEPYVRRLRYLDQVGYVVAVNTWAYVERPDLVVSLDHDWVDRHAAEVPSAPCPVLVAMPDDHPRPVVENLTYLRRVHRAPGRTRLSDDPRAVTNGLNSGFVGLNVAWLKGAGRGGLPVYLLGFDFVPGDRGQTHHDNRGEMTIPASTRRMYPRWAKILEEVKPQLDAAGVRVFNCSPTSLLAAYPYRAYDEVLP